MQLELLNEQGQATSSVDAPDTVFAREYNEALVHQVGRGKRVFAGIKRGEIRGHKGED